MQRKADEIEIPDRLQTFKRIKRQIVLTHQRFKIGIRCKDALAPVFRALVDAGIEHLHAEVTHADIIAVGEAECKPRLDAGFVFHDAARFAADVSRRLLHFQQQRFNLVKEVHSDVPPAD